MGAFFIGGQIFEYAALVSEGLTISSSPYGSVFYLTTGFHGLHVVGGLHRLPLPARSLVHRQALRSPRGHHRHRHVVLLALRRRRLDRALRGHLPPEVRRAGRPRPSLRSPIPHVRDEDRSVKALAARRHDRRAPIVLLLLALLLTGGLYAVLAPTSADAAPVKASTDDIATGEKLFQANCATCHGPSAAGTDERPVAHRRRRRGGRLPGRHRSHADADERPAGAGQAGPVRRRSRSTSSPRTSRRWVPARPSRRPSRSTRRWVTPPTAWRSSAPTARCATTPSARAVPSRRASSPRTCGRRRPRTSTRRC